MSGAEKHFVAVTDGNVTVGRISDRPALSPSAKLVSWLITIFFIGTASPFLAFVLIIVTAMLLAAKTAPADKGRTHP